MDVIRLRLPANLFEAIADISFPSHLALLEKICAIEGPSKTKAAQALLEGSAVLSSNQTPRGFYQETKRLCHTAFPNSPAHAEELAWQKLLLALPITMRQTLSLLPTQTPSETALNTLEEAWEHYSPTTAAAATREEDKRDHSLNQVLEKITARLDSLEESIIATTRQPRRSFQNRRIADSTFSSGICWYRTEFGQQARRCEPPSQSNYWRQGKELGAPSP